MVQGDFLAEICFHTHLFLAWFISPQVCVCVCFPGPAAGVRAGRGELQADQDRPGSAASDCGEVGAVGGEEWSLQR